VTVNELWEAVAELRADRDFLKEEVVGLRRELSQVKAELGRMKTGAVAGTGAASSTASAVYVTRIPLMFGSTPTHALATNLSFLGQCELLAGAVRRVTTFSRPKRVSG